MVAFWKKQEGMGLVGVLVIVGIAATVAFVGAQVIVDQSRSARIFQARSTYQRLVKHLNSILKDPRALQNSAGQASNGTAFKACVNNATCASTGLQSFNLFDGFGTLGSLAAGNGTSTHVYFDLYGNSCAGPLSSTCVFEAIAKYVAACVPGTCYANFEVIISQQDSLISKLISFNSKQVTSPITKQLPLSAVGSSSTVPVFKDKFGGLIPSSITQAIPTRNISIGSASSPATLAVDHDISFSEALPNQLTGITGDLKVDNNTRLGDLMIPCVGICPKLISTGNITVDGTLWYDNLNVGGDMFVNDSTVATSTFGVEQKMTSPIYNYSSDVRLKEQIFPIEDSLEKLSRLRAVSFNWKKDGKADIGFIAQDVEKVFPELVLEDSQGRKNLRYGNLIAVTLEAYKASRLAAQRNIEARESEIRNLQADIRAEIAKRSGGTK